MEISLKRIYDAPASDDGCRVLVERLWPRGMTKAAAALDLWLKDVAPSADLRRWYGHDPLRWPGFSRRYRVELTEHREELDQLLRLAAEGPLTLVFAARDPQICSARILRDYLLELGGK